MTASIYDIPRLPLRVRFAWKHYARSGRPTAGLGAGETMVKKAHRGRGFQDYFCCNCGEMIPRGRIHFVMGGGSMRVHLDCGKLAHA